MRVRSDYFNKEGKPYYRDKIRVSTAKEYDTEKLIMANYIEKVGWVENVRILQSLLNVVIIPILREVVNDWKIEQV